MKTKVSETATKSKKTKKQSVTTKSECSKPKREAQPVSVPAELIHTDIERSTENPDMLDIKLSIPYEVYEKSGCTIENIYVLLMV